VNELEQLTAACAQMGATPQQAGMMARQLLKRAEQLAAERSISREAALAYLLNLVVKGRAGELPPEFSSKPS
jgi:hypothetical protein